MRSEMEEMKKIQRCFGALSEFFNNLRASYVDFNECKHVYWRDNMKRLETCENQSQNLPGAESIQLEWQFRVR